MRFGLLGRTHFMSFLKRSQEEISFSFIIIKDCTTGISRSHILSTSDEDHVARNVSLLTDISLLPNN